MDQNHFAEAVQMAAVRSGGRQALCWTPGRKELALAMASAGLSVVVLESDAASGASLTQVAADMGIHTNLQVFLRQPEQVLRESVDYYNFIGVGEEALQRAEDVKGLAKRLLYQGVMAVIPVRKSAIPKARILLEAAGLGKLEVTRITGAIGLIRLLSLVRRNDPAWSLVSGQNLEVPY